MDIIQDEAINKSLTMKILTTPDLANFGGFVHGGHIMKLMDQVAYACASKYCGYEVVTRCANNISFKRPVPIGSMLIFLASINYTGNTSIEVGIKVISHDLKSGKEVHTNSGYFTMVAVDSNGIPVKVRQFIPSNDTEKKRYLDAQERRKTK